MTAQEFQKLINLAIGSFWEKNLEPVLTEMAEDIKQISDEMATKVNLKRVEEKVDNLETKMDDLSLDVKSQGRKLESEVNYRDGLEKRVQVLEKTQ